MIKNKKLQYLYSFILFLSIFIWFVIFTIPDDKLHIYACDVGQGDGFVITFGINQIVVDGGPNNNISKCLSQHMPFWDRRVEMVILTNPDRDHYFGLIQLFENYEVDTYITTTVEKSDQTYQKLLELVGGKTRTINSYFGDRLAIDSLYFDILWPPFAEATEGQANPNEMSIVFNLRYGSFKALFTGDIIPPSTDKVTGIIDVDVIKVPHHGSKNGLTDTMLQYSKPETAVISSSSDNQWGHPNEETLRLLNDKGIKIFRTDQVGEVEIVSDGQSYQVYP